MLPLLLFTFCCQQLTFAKSNNCHFFFSLCSDFPLTWKDNSPLLEERSQRTEEERRKEIWGRWPVLFVLSSLYLSLYVCLTDCVSQCLCLPIVHRTDKGNRDDDDDEGNRDDNSSTATCPSNNAHCSSNVPLLAILSLSLSLFLFASREWMQMILFFDSWQKEREREEEGGREFCRWFRWADKIVLGGAAAAAGLLAYCCWVSAFALLFQTQARSAYANRHRQSTSSIRLLRDDIYTTNCCCCCFLSSF